MQSRLSLKYQNRHEEKFLQRRADFLSWDFIYRFEDPDGFKHDEQRNKKGFVFTFCFFKKSVHNICLFFIIPYKKANEHICV